ncbi:carbohydrate ABC transporter substrate-binding protein, CUT1 family [Georgenia satyanarayanai]|uniref:Carbohydrate ABC transporter substrate-binding protein, CUT1 family n=1 Tax=Georgenia satyanarayanai TaxID=860221 RepID=A0A2Y9AS63_9MICO|nr:extracellular solute-binding protein [Georgenia satyanarayanai]PYF98452.1 carbohydrate ABC transporter substrate-binding protein (CUT1 family) [Georgenia satyanarayanai]SSA45129.1 carbohydrate ABC transporter substrate-binding protein, CUT1 family [Georgenia satyanarayanai]
MTTRQSLRTVAAAGLAGMMLAACGGGGDGDTEGADVGDGPVPLEMWVFAELHGTYYEEMAERWNEENPDRQIDLDITVYPYQDMHNNLQLAVNSGSGLPDVVDIEVSKFSNFVRGSNPPLADLTAAADPYAGDVVQARLDLYSRDGVVYGFPTHVGAMVAFYNTELLEGAGIDYTTIETWEDFEEAGASYSESTGKSFGVAPTEVSFVSSLALSQVGGNLFDENGEVAVDSPEVTEALELLSGLQEAGATSTIPGGSPDTEEAFGVINDGEYAAIVYPAWYTSRFVDYMPDLAGKIAIAPAPVLEGGEVATIGGGGTGTSVLADSPHAEIAADWLAFAKLSPEANVAVWETLGFDPVSMAVWEDEEVTRDEDNKFNQYFQTNLFDVLLEVRDDIGHFEGFTHPDFPTVDSMFTTVTLTEIFENGVPVADALAQAQSDLENQLGR